MSETRLRLGDMLVAARLVTAEQVVEALAAQRELGLRLGETMVRLGYVSEAQMTQVLSNQLSIPWVNLYHVDFSRELLERVPADVAEACSLVPVYVRQVRRQGDTLFVAMEDPLNVEALQTVADHSGLPVKPMVAAPTDIQNAIRVYYLGLPPLEEEPEEEHVVVVDGDEDEDEDADEAGDASGERAEDAAAPPPARAARSEPPPEAPAREAPAVTPSRPPPARPGLGFLTLTLLDGTTVRLPGPARGPAPTTQPERGLTTRDIIHALNARAAGEDVGAVLGDDAVESLLAALLSLLLRKGLVADWELVNEWKKQRGGKGTEP